MTRLLEPLTRPELNELLAILEHAAVKAHIALCNAPLSPAGEVARACGVAQDADAFWQEALDESVWRMWHGADRG